MNKATLTKIIGSNITRIPINENRKIEFEKYPIVGEHFIFNFNNDLFMTTEVINVEGRMFTTKNSVYKIVAIEDERDDKIVKIIN